MLASVNLISSLGLLEEFMYLQLHQTDMFTDKFCCLLICLRRTVIVSFLQISNIVVFALYKVQLIFNAHCGNGFPSIKQIDGERLDLLNGK